MVWKIINGGKLTNELDRLQAHIQEIGWQRSSKLKGYKYHNLLASQDITIAQFKNRLNERLAEQYNPNKLNMFVRNVQVQLTLVGNSLCPRMYNQLIAEESSNMLVLKRLISEEIMDVLGFLNTYFAPGFDCSMNLPNCFLLTGVRHQPLILRLGSKNIQIKLIDILHNHLNSTTDPTDAGTMTWRQYEYLNHLSGMLYCFANSASSEDDNFKLILCLIGYNFNSLLFYEYMLEYIDSLLSTYEGFDTRQATLTSLLIRIEDVRTEKIDGYDIGVTNIRDTLCEAIQRKLTFVKGIVESEFEQIVNNPKGKSGYHFFEVKVSLKQVLFQIWVLIEMELLLVKYHVMIFEFIQRFVRTKRTNRPSSGYMRNTFGRAHVRATMVKSFRDTLMKIVNFLDTEFKNLS